MADDDGLTLRDRGLITFRAALQAVPHVGPSLDQFLFGPMQERRERRVMRTLQEVGERLSQLELGSGVANERFAALLEHLAPDLARATTEERRERFRDLLFNAARLDPNSESDWENAAFAGDLLRDIEAPGLSILAGVASASSDQVTLARVPVPQVHDGTDFAWDAPARGGVPFALRLDRDRGVGSSPAGHEASPMGGTPWWRRVGASRPDGTGLVPRVVDSDRRRDRGHGVAPWSLRTSPLPIPASRCAGSRRVCSDQVAHEHRSRVPKLADYFQQGVVRTDDRVQ